MEDETAPTDDMLQEFIDGRLNDRERARVAAYLLANRDAAEKVRQIQHLDQRLKASGQATADEPVPDRLLKLIKKSLDGADRS